MEATQLESTQDDVVQATQMDPESPAKVATLLVSY